MSVQGAGEDGPVFYGQRKNIRKTKEQEMINAIAQLAQYGQWLKADITQSCEPGAISLCCMLQSLIAWPVNATHDRSECFPLSLIKLR